MIDTNSLNHHCLLQITPETTDLEIEVMRWFAAGNEVLWIPIVEVSEAPTGLADAQAEFEHFGSARLIRDVADFLALPLAIKGWLFPAHQDDTDVICIREAPAEISFGHLRHPVTGQRLTWRYDTEAPIRRQQFYENCKSKS